MRNTERYNRAKNHAYRSFRAKFSFAEYLSQRRPVAFTKYSKTILNFSAWQISVCAECEPTDRLDNERKGPQTDSRAHLTLLCAIADSGCQTLAHNHNHTISFYQIAICTLGMQRRKYTRDTRVLISRRNTRLIDRPMDRNATQEFSIKTLYDLLMRMSFPWHSISKWWFMTSDGWTKPPRWLCNGSWCANGPLMSVIAIFFGILT